MQSNARASARARIETVRGDDVSYALKGQRARLGARED